MTSRRSRRTRARALVAAAAVLAVSAAAACSSSAQPGAAKNTTLTVVAFNPFTGPDASFGPEQLAGCQAAATAINAAGGVLTDKVACTSVDTRGDPADAVTGGAKMLATASHLFAVLGPSSDESDATAPLINAAKVPMFADTGEGSFDQTKLQYFWRMTPADDVQGYAMALYAKQKGYLRGAAVFGDDISSQGSVPTLLKAFKALGGNMVINKKIALGQTSYQPEVEQVIAAKPQVIFSEASPQANATFLAELQQLGHLIPVIGTDGTSQPYNKDLLASASVPKPAQWSTDSYTMTAYDGIIVSALAATAAKSTSPAVWNASIPAVTTASPGAVKVHSYADGLAALHADKKIDYVGAAGVIAFNQWHNSTGGFEIAAYQPSGDLVLVDSITAAQLAPLIK